MQIITGELEGYTEEYPLSQLGDRKEILAVDIETTGLSPEKAKIYLIGCAWWDAGKNQWQTIQWFDDDGNGESDILTSFILFAKKFHILLHYNGDRFDLPFLARRIVWNGLQGIPGAENFPSGMQSADLYKYLKPYQSVLSLPDLRQQTVEKYLETGRTEEESGGRLIQVYEHYLAAKKDPESDPAFVHAMRSSLLAHNLADIGGLIAISRVIGYHDIFTAKINVYKAQANTYSDAQGNPVQELWMFAKTEELPEDILKKPVTTNRDGCFLTINGNKVTIKVPIYTGRAYYFYANFKDYYYLPELDQAIHKSIATFVDSRRREQATARNCYTAKVGAFLPEWTGKAGSTKSIPYEPFFKRSYEDHTAWFAFTDEMKKDRRFFTDYAEYIYSHVIAG